MAIAMEPCGATRLCHRRLSTSGYGSVLPTTFPLHHGPILLSTRLQIIYDRILPGHPLWDIGCDHGYVGLRAFSSGLCSEVHLVDRALPAIDHLRDQIAERWPNGSGKGLRIWHSDAEHDVLPVAHGTVVMAGMGNFIHRPANHGSSFFR